MPRPLTIDNAAVLDRAVEILWRDGCDSVSIRDLERVCGLKAPSLYQRFESRDSLVAAAIDRYVTTVVAARVRRHLTDGDDPITGIRSFFTSVLEPFPGEDVPRGCLLTSTTGQRALIAPPIRRAVEAGLGAIEQGFCAAIERSLEAGDLVATTEPATLALALLAAFEGVLLLTRLGRVDLRPSVDALLDALLASHR